MKTRKGFVSNSSTTSFFIYGVNLDISGEELIKKIQENISEELKQLVLNKNNELAQEAKWRKEYDSFDKYMEQHDDWYELFSDLGKVVKGVTVEQPPDGSIYIGVDTDSIKEDETGKEFKERIKVLIKSLLGEDIDGFGYHSEAWRDG